MARKERKSRSEILRDAFLFLQASKELDRLQQVGASIAQKLNIETDDDVGRFLAEQKK